MPSIATLRHTPWSLSKVKCARRCPQEFQLRYVDRIPEPEVAPDTRVGKAVHAALEAVLLHAPVDRALATAREELLHDEERRRFDTLAGSVRKFRERIDAFRGQRRVRTELVEHRLAVNSELAPTGFFARDAFFRGVWDVGFLYDDGCLAVVDHKTGVRREIFEFSDQLEGYAILAAAHVAQVKKVFLGVHFVADAAMEWIEPIGLDAVRRDFAPRVVAELEQAARELAGGPEPRPSGWCRRCSYRSICPATRRVDRAAWTPLEPDPDADPASDPDAVAAGERAAP